MKLVATRLSKLPMTALALIAAIGLGGGVNATTALAADRGVSTVGQGRVTAAPDIARVVFGVEITEASLETALSNVAGQMNAVVSRLTELGVNQNDIKTVRFSVSPVYDNRQPSPNGASPAPVLR